MNLETNNLQIPAGTAEKIPADRLMAQLMTTDQGLSADEAQRRSAQVGANEIPEATRSALVQFLGYLWGPIPWMIEVAALLSLVVHHWMDLSIIVILLFFNAVIGYWQEHQAGNAVAALKKRLALKSRVRRDGRWQLVDAKVLVPGDIIRLRLGDIIPADGKLIDGDYLSVDQSALTGESLPVNKEKGDIVYSGAVAKQGEMVALVTATGQQTYFGNTARLVADAGQASHFQKAVLQIGNYLIYLSLALVAVLLVVQLLRGAPFTELLQFALILTVASIPVAMPAVLSVTMAVGAMALSRMKAIVARLESIEEMAGMDILCSDKTGTLTRNTLTLAAPQPLEGVEARELVLTAALASKAENNDSIDLAVMEGLEDPQALSAYEAVSFVPFDPVAKRTEATVRDSSGRTFKVTKGAPQVVMDLAGLDEQSLSRAQAAVDAAAAKGWRTLGVARTLADGAWQYMGLLPLLDPPREDSAETIAQAGTHGIAVKMVTGDNLAIARETSANLGLGRDIKAADALLSEEGAQSAAEADLGARVEAADGFAQVFPEHKFRIVKALQARKHIVGMTGDGVNDAPALKQADIGIAVSGATDAARAAADLVLTAPGLSVIVRAVEEARRIFERMNSYAVYRIIAVATVMGLTGVVGSFFMLYIALDVLHLGIAQVQTYIFLKMAVAGHLTLFVARSKDFFLKKPHPAPVMIWSAVATKLIGTLLAAYGFGLITPIGWKEIALIWIYSVTWAFITDWAKMRVYHHFDKRTGHHQSASGGNRQRICLHSYSRAQSGSHEHHGRCAG